jgi:hypothetical protein
VLVTVVAALVHNRHVRTSTALAHTQPGKKPGEIANMRQFLRVCAPGHKDAVTPMFAVGAARYLKHVRLKWRNCASSVSY